MNESPKNQTVETGGSAFPFSTEHHQEWGMELLDYYAAHAPKVPFWFAPKFKDAPLVPPPLRNRYIEGKEAIWIRALDDDGTWYDEEEGWEHGPVPDSFKKEVEEYLEKRREALDKRSKWNDDNKIQSLVQWRFYYAVAMVKARKEVQS